MKHVTQQNVIITARVMARAAKWAHWPTDERTLRRICVKALTDSIAAAVNEADSLLDAPADDLELPHEELLDVTDLL